MPQRLYTPYKNRNGLKMRCKKCECSKKDLRQADWPGWKGATNRPQERHGKGVRQRRANTPCAGRVCTCVISVACARNAIRRTNAWGTCGPLCGNSTETLNTVYSAGPAAQCFTATLFSSMNSFFYATPARWIRALWTQRHGNERYWIARNYFETAEKLLSKFLV